MESRTRTCGVVCDLGTPRQPASSEENTSRLPRSGGKRKRSPRRGAPHQGKPGLKAWAGGKGEAAAQGRPEEELSPSPGLGQGGLAPLRERRRLSARVRRMNPAGV